MPGFFKPPFFECKTSVALPAEPSTYPNWLNPLKIFIGRFCIIEHLTQYFFKIVIK